MSERLSTILILKLGFWAICTVMDVLKISRGC